MRRRTCTITTTNKQPTRPSHLALHMNNANALAAVVAACRHANQHCLVHATFLMKLSCVRTKSGRIVLVCMC
jgi:hypothetical protein